LHQQQKQDVLGRIGAGSHCSANEPHKDAPSASIRCSVLVPQCRGREALFESGPCSSSCKRVDVCDAPRRKDLCSRSHGSLGEPRRAQVTICLCHMPLCIPQALSFVSQDRTYVPHLPLFPRGVPYMRSLIVLRNPERAKYAQC
jgi:hypothetical protein